MQLRNRVVALALGLVLGACGASARSTPKDQERAALNASCEGAVSTVVKIERAAEPAKRALHARCTEDEWSAEATVCMRKATTGDALHQCRHLYLTGQQDEGVDAALGDPEATAELTAMAGFRDKMCKCTDADCAKQVSDEITKWSDTRKQPAKMTEAQTKRGTAIGTQASECMQKAMGAGGSLVDGAADDDPPPPEEEDDTAPAAPVARPPSVTKDHLATADKLIAVMDKMGADITAAGTDCSKAAAAITTASKALKALKPKIKALETLTKNDEKAKAWFESNYMGKMMRALGPLMTISGTCDSDAKFKAALKGLDFDD